MHHNKSYEANEMYGFFDYLKRTSFIFLHIIILMIICHFSYAGNLIEVDGFTMYSNDYGEVVKDSWVWIDTNNDSIAGRVMAGIVQNKQDAFLFLSDFLHHRTDGRQIQVITVKHIVGDCFEIVCGSHQAVACPGNIRNNDGLAFIQECSHGR